MSISRRLTARGSLTALALTTAMVVAACGSSGNGKKTDASASGGKALKGAPLKVGVVVAKSGNFSNFGIGEEVAAKLAVEQINASGGAGGRPIELIVKDSGGVPDQAISV